MGKLSADTQILSLYLSRRLRCVCLCVCAKLSKGGGGGWCDSSIMALSALSYREWLSGRGSGSGKGRREEWNALRCSHTHASSYPSLPPTAGGSSINTGQLRVGSPSPGHRSLSAPRSPTHWPTRI